MILYLLLVEILELDWGFREGLIVSCLVDR